MENIISINNQLIPLTEDKSMNAFVKSYRVIESEMSPVYEKLSEKGCENFINYISRLGLTMDNNTIVLSSFRHYYYDPEEFANIKTVVNLKQLNQITRLRDFLHVIYNILPDKSNFIGSFINGKNRVATGSNSKKLSNHKTWNIDAIENNIRSGILFLNRIFDLLDLSTTRYLTEKEAVSILKEEGLAVSDMTEMDGITYFCSLKSQAVA